MRKVLEILSRWSNRGLGYHIGKDGIYFSFHGLPIYISFPTGRVDVCLHPADVEGMPPFLEIELPIDDRLVEVFWNWRETMLWSQLSLGVPKEESHKRKGKERNGILYRLLSRQRKRKGRKCCLFTRAQLPSELVCEHTLYHVLVEVTSGYWTLLKMLSDNGFLRTLVWQKSRNSLKNNEKAISKLTEGALAIKPYRPEETRSLISSLNQEFTKLMFVDRSEPLPQDLPKIPGIRSMWGGTVLMRQFRSEDIERMIMPIRESVDHIGGVPLLTTVCQGFAATKFYPKDLFCALRFVVRMGNLSDFTNEQIQKWKKSLIFLDRPLIPSRWIPAKIGGGILLHINLPIYTDLHKRIIKLDYQLPNIEKDPVSKRLSIDIFGWERFAEYISARAGVCA